MTNLIIKTDLFKEQFEDLNEDQKQWIRKIAEQLKFNSEVGKPLGYKWIREKKHNGFRLYYLVYKQENKIALIAFGPKKDQKKIIANIFTHLEEYNKIVEGTNP